MDAQGDNYSQQTPLNSPSGVRGLKLNRMKTKKILFVILAVMVTVIHSATAQKKVSTSKTVVLSVMMHSDHCKRRIEKYIPFEKGVKDLVVKLENNTVIVVYDSTKTTVKEVIAAFNKIGYDVHPVGD